MATLSGFVLRIIAVCSLTVALAALYPNAARAQSGESPAAATSDDAGGGNQPAADNGKSVPPETAAPINYGTAAKPDSSVNTDSSPTSGAEPAAKSEPATGRDGEAATESDSSVKSESAPSDQYVSHAALKTIDAMPHTGDRNFDHAAELFPAFCKDWQRKLHDRELNNLETMSWKDQNGWKTGTYLSYSPVKTCDCKHSTGGVPIGELTYQETELYLSGRTVEEARHAQPKPVAITNTTEIFRWDKTKWDDGR
jgi:hypothetical protein